MPVKQNATETVTMNRTEALRILGLNEDATPEEIKAAYKETVQILHPDRFANNKKLQERATEQFKNLQDAYDFLSSAKGAKKAGGSSAGSSRASVHSAEVQAEARLAGIKAARTQLVKQRDVVLDERRNGAIMAVVGGIAALLTVRRPFGILGMVAAIASAATVYGIVQVVSAQRTLNTLEEHITDLRAQEKRILKDLGE